MFQGPSKKKKTFWKHCGKRRKFCRNRQFQKNVLSSRGNNSSTRSCWHFKIASCKPSIHVYDIQSNLPRRLSELSDYLSYATHLLCPPRRIFHNNWAEFNDLLSDLTYDCIIRPPNQLSRLFLVTLKRPPINWDKALSLFNCIIRPPKSITASIFSNFETTPINCVISFIQPWMRLSI